MRIAASGILPLTLVLLTVPTDPVLGQEGSGLLTTVRRIQSTASGCGDQAARAEAVLNSGRGGSEGAEIFHALGSCLWRRGDYAAAERCLRATLAIRRDLLQDDPQVDLQGESDLRSEIANTLLLLGRVLRERGDYAGAEPVLREALAIRRARHSGPARELATCLDELGLLVWRQGDYQPATTLIEAGLAMRRDLPEESALDVAASLEHLGVLLRYQNDLAGAEPLLRQALQIRRRLLGENHLAFASSLYNLGLLRWDRGYFAEAEPCLRRALTIRRLAAGDEHPLLIENLIDLALLLRELGNFGDAAPLLREAVNLSRRRLGEEHPHYARCLHNLGLLLASQRKWKESESYFREALALSRRILGDEHPDVTALYHNFASSLWQGGQAIEAEPLLRQALAISRREMGDDHRRVAYGLLNLADVLLDLGRDQEAESLLQELLLISPQAMGEVHRDLPTCYSLLACIRSAQGEDVEAEALLRKAAAIYEAVRRRTGQGMRGAAFQDSPYRQLATVQLRLGQSNAAWRSTEQDLGRSLAELLRQAGHQTLTPAEWARQDSLQTSRDHLLEQLETMRVLARTDANDALQRQIEASRSALLRIESSRSEFEETVEQKRGPVGAGEILPLTRVQDALSAEMALIGWLDVKQRRGQYVSWCYVVRDTGSVHWVQLPAAAGGGEVSPVVRCRTFRDQLASAGMLGLPAPMTDEVRAAAHAMWRERVAPIESALEGIRKLVVVPSGAMLGVPVEALVDAPGRYLGDRYAICYVPSATIFAWLQEQAEGGNRGRRRVALLVGDPTLAEEQDGTGAEATGTGSLAARRALWPLPWARQEIEEVAGVFQGSTVLLGHAASEPELVEQVATGQLARYDVIHLATHALMDDERPLRSALVLSQVGLPDPLEALLSGSRVHDGLLTVSEIIREWRLGAELVTLSACETGLGREVTGEGHVGLAHACFQAGARSLLVSLWSVNDRATAVLMRRFYENLLGNYEDLRAGRRATAMTKTAALREAKAWLRAITDARGHHPFAHPFYWAGFILFGESD